MVSQLVASYFPPSYQNTGPSLCRLYFGTTYWDRAPSRFITTVNFPLEKDRCNVLANAFANLCPLPVTADVARGMGEMLGHLHHTARVDARDMEFVLGGDGGDGCTYFIITDSPHRSRSGPFVDSDSVCRNLLPKRLVLPSRSRRRPTPCIVASKTIISRSVATVRLLTCAGLPCRNRGETDRAGQIQSCVSTRMKSCAPRYYFSKEDWPNTHTDFEID